MFVDANVLIDIFERDKVCSGRRCHRVLRKIRFQALTFGALFGQQQALALQTKRPHPHNLMNPGKVLPDECPRS